MNSHHQRFERWRTKLPDNTRYLIDQVVDRILPEFKNNGFGWYDDYAGGNPKEVSHNQIPLQFRSGEQWPTVEIRFDKRARPFFMIDFAMLPAICRRMFGTQDIPRELAIVPYAPAYFRLSKGEQKGANGTFGYIWISFAPKRKIDSEVDSAITLLPGLLDFLRNGIPADWLTCDKPWYVEKNIILMGSWHIDQLRREKKAVDRKGHGLG